MGVIESTNFLPQFLIPILVPVIRKVKMKKNSISINVLVWV